MVQYVLTFLKHSVTVYNTDKDTTYDEVFLVCHQQELYFLVYKHSVLVERLLEVWLHFRFALVSLFTHMNSLDCV